MGSLSNASLIMFNLSGVKCMLCMYWCSSIGMFSFYDGNQLRWSRLLLNCIIIFLEL